MCLLAAMSFSDALSDLFASIKVFLHQSTDCVDLKIMVRQRSHVKGCEREGTGIGELEKGYGSLAPGKSSQPASG